MSRKDPLSFRAGCLVLILGSLGGCGPSTIPVEGQVVFTDGKAATELAGGTVGFESLDRTPIVSAYGTIADDGSFALATAEGDRRVPLGRYRAVVLPRQATELDKPGPRPVVMDPRYQRFETANLEFTVEPKENRFVIRVERAAEP